VIFDDIAGKSLIVVFTYSRLVRWVDEYPFAKEQRREGEFNAIVVLCCVTVGDQSDKMVVR